MMLRPQRRNSVHEVRSLGLQRQYYFISVTSPVSVTYLCALVANPQFVFASSTQPPALLASIHTTRVTLPDEPRGPAGRIDHELLYFGDKGRRTSTLLNRRATSRTLLQHHAVRPSLRSLSSLSQSRNPGRIQEWDYVGSFAIDGAVINSTRLRGSQSR